MMRLVVALAFLLLNFQIYNHFSSAAVVPQRVSLTRFPLQLDDWRCDDPQTLTDDIIQRLGVTDYLVCTFVRQRSDEVVGVYLGYHEMQVRKEAGVAGESMIHPPAHCLPGSGWDIVAAQLVPLDIPGLPGAPAEVNRLVIAKGEARQLVYYWYQERGHVIARDWEKILQLFWSRATTHRTDGALVRFTVPMPRGDEANADASFQALAREIVPRLPTYIPN